MDGRSRMVDFDGQANRIRDYTVGLRDLIAVAIALLTRVCGKLSLRQ
jgi:hypothetical protein